VRDATGDRRELGGDRRSLATCDANALSGWFGHPAEDARTLTRAAVALWTTSSGGARCTL